MVCVYISIGSNINRETNIRAAIDALRHRYGHLLLSRVFESESVGFQGENFYNLVAGFDTDESVHEVIHTLHHIEQFCGRSRQGPRFGSRVLDLDLLLYGDLVVNEPGLQLPRNDILKYAFVLQPLAEIAPHLRHPVVGKCYADLWATFNHASQHLWPVDLRL